MRQPVLALATRLWAAIFTEEVSGVSTRCPVDNAGDGGGDVAQVSMEQGRAALTARIVSFGTGFAAFGIVLYALVYLRTTAWQMLDAAAGVALALLYLIQARRLVPRAEFDAAGYCIIGALLGAALLTIQLVVYIPLLQGIFKTLALPPADLAISLLMSSVVFWGIELGKRLFPSQ